MGKIDIRSIDFEEEHFEKYEKFGKSNRNKNINEEDIKMRETKIKRLQKDLYEARKKIEIDLNDIVIKEYKDMLRGQAGFGWQPYITASNFCLQNNTHIDQGLEWIDASIAINQNFQNLSIQAFRYRYPEL